MFAAALVHIKTEKVETGCLDEDMPAAEQAVPVRRGQKRKAAPVAPLTEEPLSEHDEIRAKRIFDKAEKKRAKHAGGKSRTAGAAAAYSDDESSAEDTGSGSSSSEEEDDDSDVKESPRKKRRVDKDKKNSKAVTKDKKPRPKRAAPKRKPKVKAKNPVMEDPAPIVPIEDGTARTLAPRVVPFANIVGLERMEHDFDHLDLNPKCDDRCKTPGQAKALSRKVTEAALRRVRLEGFTAVKKIKQEAGAVADESESGGKEEKKQPAAAAAEDGSDPGDVKVRADTEDRADKESKKYNRLLQDAMDALQMPEFNLAVFDVGGSESSQEVLVNQIRESKLEEPVLSAATIQLLLFEAGTFTHGNAGSRTFPACPRVATGKCTTLESWGWPGTSLMLEHEIKALIENNTQPKALRYCYICSLDTVGYFITVMRSQKRCLDPSQIVQPFSVLTEKDGGFFESCCWQAANSSGRWEGLIGNFPMFRKEMFVPDVWKSSVLAGGKPQHYLDHSAMVWKRREQPRPAFGEKLSTF